MFLRQAASATRVVDVSDRNVLCLAVRGDFAVLGLADHGLVELNVRVAARGDKRTTAQGKSAVHFWIEAP